MIITFGGHDLFLHHSGALYWPEEKMLIVSDLHLEKGSHFARRGFFLPPYDSHDTLETLERTLRETEATRLLLLGDAFHDVKGYDRLGVKERLLFDTLQAFSPIWIVGNHDGDFVPPGFTGMEDYEFRGLTFRHQATLGAIHEISGHFHPKAEIALGGGRSSCPCYIEDGGKLILPAFGSYTGGLSVTDPVIAKLFAFPPNLYLLGESRVYRVENQSASLLLGDITRKQELF